MGGRWKLITLGGLLILTLTFVLFWSSEWEPKSLDEVAGTIGVGENETGGAADVPAAPAKHIWLDANGEPFPLQTDEEICEFLESAKVTGKERIEQGINQIDQLLLEKDGMQLRGAFRVVKVFKPQIKMADGTTHLNFRDDFRFELAAFRLSRLLGLDNVPPAVRRKIGRDVGSLQIWVEGAMTEVDRLKEGLTSPDPEGYRQQIQTMRLFDQLIANEDRNQGNILTDSNWKLWMIDHTRSFRRLKEPKLPNLVVSCKRALWEKLQSLDEQIVKQEMKGILTGDQVKALMSRRDKLVDHIRARISRVGEASVLL